MKSLLEHLPFLTCHAGEIDLAASHPHVVLAVAEAAEESLRGLHVGLGALGSILMRFAPEQGLTSTDLLAIRDLGDLIAQLSAAAGFALNLAKTADVRQSISSRIKAGRGSLRLRIWLSADANASHAH